LAPLTQKLTERRAELQAEISRKRGDIRGGHVGFDASTSTDGGDGAQITATGSVHHAEIERDTAELNDIASAMERIAAGTYGFCTECGERIVDARLSVWPTAKRCTPCQRQVERARSKSSSL
jgi:DnaK suppressor protein